MDKNELDKVIALHGMEFSIDSTKSELDAALTKYHSRMTDLRIKLSIFQDAIKTWNGDISHLRVNRTINFIFSKKKVFFPKDAIVYIDKEEYSKCQVQQKITQLKKDLKATNVLYSKAETAYNTYIESTKKTLDEQIEDKIKYYEHKIQELKNLIS